MIEITVYSRYILTKYFDVAVVVGIRLYHIFTEFFGVMIVVGMRLRHIPTKYFVVVVLFNNLSAQM